MGQDPGVQGKTNSRSRTWPSAAGGLFVLSLAT
jgi:hypothetical protein